VSVEPAESKYASRLRDYELEADETVLIHRAQVTEEEMKQEHPTEYVVHR